MTSVDEPVPWAVLLTETVEKLASHGVGDPPAEARWILEEITGAEGAELLLVLDEPATQRGVAHLDQLVARRVAGEPIQYVLGRWSFRTLDLLCDRRVLIPRPETEQVVDHVLTSLDDVRRRRDPDHRPTVVELGTGSGAIALSIAVERPGTDVWGTDVSPDALAVARANLGGLGMAGGAVRLSEGSWFEALPTDLTGHIDLIVSNPPYIAADEELDDSVRDWEPDGALVSGPTGLEAHELIIAHSVRWLAPDGVLVLEIGTAQGAAVTALARDAGFDPVRSVTDHAGHDRTVIARRS